MPHHVIRQAIDAVASTFSHFGEPFCLGLVLEGVGREIDACALLVSGPWFGTLQGMHTRSMNVSLDENVNAAYAVEWNLDVFIVAPIAH